MTIFSTDVCIPFPRDLVYPTYRDKLVELVPYLPDVKSIVIKSRREEGAKIHFVSDWHVGGDIPFAARAILSDEMLSWTEYTTWDESELTMEWRLETHAFTEAVLCRGKNYFRADGNTTIIENRGELNIDSTKIKGVPHFIANQIAHVVEDFLGKQIEPNLIQMSGGVRLYLEQEAKAAKVEQELPL